MATSWRAGRCGPRGSPVVQRDARSPAAAIGAEDDEDEEKTDGEGGGHEEVDGDEVSGLRGEKGAPGGRRPRRRPVHVRGDGQLGDEVAEQSEFWGDAPAAPGGVRASQAPDEIATFGVEPRAADRVRPSPPSGGGGLHA